MKSGARMRDKAVAKYKDVQAYRKMRKEQGCDAGCVPRVVASIARNVSPAVLQLLVIVVLHDQQRSQ